MSMRKMYYRVTVNGKESGIVHTLEQVREVKATYPNAEFLTVFEEVKEEAPKMSEKHLAMRVKC